LFESGYGYNTLNQYKTLFGTNDHPVKKSEGSINLNLSYHTETILST